MLIFQNELIKIPLFFFSYEYYPMNNYSFFLYKCLIWKKFGLLIKVMHVRRILGLA